MNKYVFEQREYILKALTPVHVGYGDVVDVFNFVVDPQKSSILILDMDKFYACLSSKDRERLINICKKGELYSIVELYKFMASQLNMIKSNSGIVVEEIKVCRGFLSHYDKVKSLPRDKLKELNRFQIFKFAINPNLKHPIIPGSSLKGSIRTAVLNYYRHRASKRDYEPKEADKLEKDILGYTEVHEDIMKFLKVSDFLPLKDVKTKIVYAINRKKDGKRASGPYQMFEIIEPGAEFRGTISVVRADERFSFEIIEKAIKDFYEKIYKSEDEIYKRIGTKRIPVCSHLPLKVGRHSSAEAVTIEGFRKIKIKTGENRYLTKDKATTLWLCSEYPRPKNNEILMPMGWMELIPSNLKDLKLHKDKKDSIDISVLQSKFRVKIIS